LGDAKGKTRVFHFFTGTTTTAATYTIGMIGG